MTPVPDPNVSTPGGTHKAAASGPLSSLPWRTTIQGVGVDVLLAVCLLSVEATSSAAVDWRLLLLSLAKTVLMTLASSVMRRVRPPVSPPG